MDEEKKAKIDHAWEESEAIYGSDVALGAIGIGLLIGLGVVIAMFPSELGSREYRISTLHSVWPWIVLGIVSLVVAIAGDIWLIAKRRARAAWPFHACTLGCGGYMLLGLIRILLDRLGRL